MPLLPERCSFFSALSAWKQSGEAQYQLQPPCTLLLTASKEAELQIGGEKKVEIWTEQEQRKGWGVFLN